MITYLLAWITTLATSFNMSNRSFSNRCTNFWWGFYRILTFVTACIMRNKVSLLLFILFSKLFNFRGENCASFTLWCNRYRNIGREYFKWNSNGLEFWPKIVYINLEKESSCHVINVDGGTPSRLLGSLYI